MICDKASPSRLDLYEQCPLRYYARYELKMRGHGSAATKFGLLFHGAAENYYDPELDLTEEQAWEKAKKENDCDDFQDFQDVKRLFFGETKKYPKAMTDTIAVEQSFDFEIDNGVVIRGFIDRVDKFDEKSIGINDYKTGNWVPSSEEVELSHQSNMYPLWVFESGKYGKPEGVFFDYHYVKTGQLKSVYRTPESLDVYKEYLKYLVDQIVRNDNPQPKINIFCYNCEYRTECPAYQTIMKANFSTDDAKLLLGVPSDMTVETMARRSKQLGGASKAISTDKKLIDDWILATLQEHDTKEWDLGDMKVKAVSRSMTSFDVGTVLDLIKTLPDPSKVISVKKEVLNAFAHDSDALDRINSTSRTVRTKPYVKIGK
jgi:putative RecB family exonuclease